MRNVRLIARLDIKAPNLVKGIHLEGLKKIGNPNEYAVAYYQHGIDELIYEDIVASLYNRNSLLDVIEKTTNRIFVPIIVGGGLRSVDDVSAVLRAGADKISINSEALKRPNIISEVANRFGSQCMVLSVQAKRRGNSWEAFYDNGREPSGIDVLDWVEKSQGLGAGEILLTSVDKEGTRSGFDVDLVRAVSKAVDIPVIASGGMGNLSHLNEIVSETSVDGVAMAHVLHNDIYSVAKIRKYCQEQDIPVRNILISTDE